MFLKLKTILIILFVDAGFIFSQQLPVSNQYLVNKNFLSPSYAGFTDNFEVFINYQKNCLTFPGSPEYKSIYASGPIYGNMSLGLSVSQSSATIFNVISSQLDYAYHLKVNENQYIHFGLSLELIQNYFGVDNQTLTSQNDPYLLKNGHALNAGFGLVYSFKAFQIGVAIPRMLESKIRNSDSDNNSYSLPQLLRMNASCSFDINQVFSLEPFVVVDKSNVDPLWYNISALLKYKGIIWMDLNYQQGGIMGFGLGFNLSKKMLVNYTYEFSGAGIMKYSSGIHEISIGFLIGKNKNQKYQRSAFRSLSKQPYYDWIK